MILSEFRVIIHLLKVYMTKTLTKQIFNCAKNAQIKINNYTPTQKNQLERAWDIEHAYYSSVLEGSKLDRKDFEKLAESVS